MTRVIDTNTENLQAGDVVSYRMPGVGFVGNYVVVQDCPDNEGVILAFEGDRKAGVGYAEVRLIHRGTNTPMQTVYPLGGDTPTYIPGRSLNNGNQHPLFTELWQRVADFPPDILPVRSGTGDETSLGRSATWLLQRREGDVGAAQFARKREQSEGCLTWATVLVEGVARTLVCTDRAALRGNLVRLAALCLRWAQWVDYDITGIDVPLVKS